VSNLIERLRRSGYEIAEEAADRIEELEYQNAIATQYLIEAEAELAANKASLVEQHNEWSAHCEVIAKQRDEALERENDWKTARIKLLQASNERLRAHIEWIGANTDSPSTALYCRAALENDDDDSH
jgi:hypothetical protein